MDSSLKIINKKTWNHTKPIMVWNVLAFFDAISLMITYFLDAGSWWFLGDIALLIIFIIMAVHSAWLLEEKL